MNRLIVFIVLLAGYFVHAQEKKTFQIEGQLVDKNGIAIADAYLINYRTMDKYTSQLNGVFNLWVQSTDSLAITHISYHEKTITVYELLVNPIVTLELDSIAIKEINISPNQLTDREKAMKNIKSIEFDFRAQPGDLYTEEERMNELVKTENRVERSAASSLSLIRFSPSELIGNLKKKRKQRKKSEQFNSTKKIKQEQESK